MNVLIVDDEQDLLDLVSEVMKLYGHKTITALSGNLAVEKLKSEAVDVVVSDLKMPDGDGLFLLNFVNQMTTKPMFFLVSGHADYSPNEALSAGATKFFQKPYEIEDLIAAIEVQSSPTRS